MEPTRLSSTNSVPGRRHEATRWAALIALAIVGGLAGPGADSAVFGTDERKGYGAHTTRHFASIGLLYSNDEANGLDGTATLVTPLRILSAAHVFYGPDGRLRAPLASYRFRLGSDFVSQRYEEVAVASIVASGTRTPYVEPEGVAGDWIVLELERPIVSVPPAVLAPPRKAPESGAVQDPAFHTPRGVRMAGYHIDVHGGLRRVQTRCRVLERPAFGPQTPPALIEAMRHAGVLLHDCDSAGHSSGAGLFARGSDEVDRLVGLNVGGIGPRHARRADPIVGNVNLALAISPLMRAAFDAETP